MKSSSHTSEDGFSLIEVLIALVILAIVILGGGMYFFYGRLGINREGCRRAALELASQRIEELKAADYSDIARDPSSSDPYYITYGSDWEISTGEVEETIEVGNCSNGKMVTKAEYKDNDNDDPPNDFDYLKITVTVSWGDNPDNKAQLITFVAP